ncbi:MBL fold metallo-hydrolase [Bdellovibrio sp. NC01]|uniref:MBL fold metallo-hydrolase n=1 Tax=Bdellovibrio sp. NC01 TaxID=2220073 RepID=UPI00115B7238|nr:MBL fold metallo-hydrolase [Bdellovibrio sp. NC01]QDK39330.1 MBL fold metallo-hydrolase [Bdellovibrio sp. NC01]
MLKISRILHAGYVFESGATTIACDPLFENPFSRNCYAFPEVRFVHEEIKRLKFDAVFISHYHDDHCSMESLNYLDRSTPIYMFCLFEEMFTLIKQLGFTNVYPLTLNQAVTIGDITVTPRKALDEDVDSMFHVQAGGLNVLNVVDSWIDYDTVHTLGQYKWDLIMWPFQTMREVEVIAPKHANPAVLSLPPEWLEQLQELRPKYLVPSSCQFRFEIWSWYNNAFFPISYKQFSTEIKENLPNTFVTPIMPGRTFVLSKDGFVESGKLSWVQASGEQNVDYEFKAGLIPPATAEIARYFPALSVEQMQRVMTFCQEEIISRHLELGASDDEYWQVPRRWKLSLYDSMGVATEFNFLIDGDEMKPVVEINNPEWTTEVPFTRVYGALENGESLTSMYVRVNDGVPPNAEIAEANVVDDPLLRALYNGAFGSYQKAQMRVIKKELG